MRDTERKPGLAFWAAVTAVTIPTLYVLAIGPLEWLDLHDLLPDSLRTLLSCFYAPLQWLYENGPAPVKTALDWYVGLWGG